LTAVKAKKRYQPARKVNWSARNPEVEKQIPADVSQSNPSAESPITRFSSPVMINRPPMKKYIRKIGLPGQERITIEVVQKQPEVLSIEELREKFGLTKLNNVGISSGNWLKTG